MNAAPFRALAEICSRSCCPEMSSARPKESDSGSSIAPEDAFDLLRRSSQNLNVKLRDVARGLAETGEFRMTGSSRLADEQ